MATGATSIERPRKNLTATTRPGRAPGFFYECYERRCEARKAEVRSESEVSAAKLATELAPEATFKTDTQ